MHGMPRLMYENMPFQILQTPKQILFMFQCNREFRIIDMNAAHEEPPGPLYLGQSVWHWDGDTVAIDTNSFDASTFLDASGMPHSDALHVVERYRVVGGRLVANISIDDPKTFSRPWRCASAGCLTRR